MITKIGRLPKSNNKLKKYEITETDKSNFPEFDFTPPKISKTERIEENESSSDSENLEITENDNLIFSVVNGDEDFVEISKLNDEFQIEKFTDLLIYDEIFDIQSFSLLDSVYVALALESCISIYDVFIYNSLTPQITLDQQNVTSLNLKDMNLYATSNSEIWDWDLPSLEIKQKFNAKEKINATFLAENNLIYATKTNLFNFDFRNKTSNSILKMNEITKICLKGNEIYAGNLHGDVNLFDKRKADKPIKSVKQFDKAVSGMFLDENSLLVSSTDKTLKKFSKNLENSGIYRHFEPITTFEVFSKNEENYEILIGGLGEDILTKKINF